ncbi:MAG: DUF262 domain-containing protein [Hyphomicrobiaceae bacterium]|nr:DUF262 domain-containing protein [Hyphomicrobiaceae bacterium]
MFARLPVASLTLRELIASNSVFSVPPFQRPYAWGVEQAIQMFDDVASAAGLDAPELAEPDYFLGTVLLLASEGTGLPTGETHVGSPAEYQIIDGQQRLTTLTILFAALRDSLEGDGDAVERISSLVLVPSVIRDQTVGQPAAFLPSRLVLSGRERVFFNRNVQRPGCCAADFEAEEPQTEAARRILAVRDAFCSALELLAPADRRRLADYLMGNCHVVVTLSHEIDRAHRLFTVINERGKPLQRNDILKVEVLSGVDGDDADTVHQWEEAERLVGGDFESLFSHLRTIYDRPEQRIVSAVRGLVADVGGSEPFVGDVLLPYARIQAGIVAASQSAEAAGVPYAANLYYLGRLTGAEWMPSVMLTLRMHHSSPEIAHALVAAIDRTAYLLRVMCQGSGRRATKFQAITRAIASGAAVSGDAEVFAFNRDEQRTAAYNLRDLYRRNQQVSKLLLLRINDVIEGRVRGVDPLDYSVEHVLPLRPPANSSWRNLIPDPELRDLATACLGNLTLLPCRLNAKIRNSDFGPKRDMLKNGLTQEATLAIARDVMEAQNWDFDTIKAREAVLLEAAAKILRIDVSETPIARDKRRRASRT